MVHKIDSESYYKFLCVSESYLIQGGLRRGGLEPAVAPRMQANIRKIYTSAIVLVAYVKDWQCCQGAYARKLMIENCSAVFCNRTPQHGR